MVTVNPIFDSKLFGNGITATKDDWYDVGTVAVYPANSPIPSGKQLRVGFLNVHSQQKPLIFELRTNTAGTSTGTEGNTVLLASTATDPASGSKWEDVYQNGNIAPALAPVAASTGVEKLWLRVVSQTNAAVSFQWFLYYTLQE